jgi:hypothetical protein
MDELGAFLRAQAEALTQLQEPPIRLCDYPRLDSRGRPTEERHIYLAGGQDALHRSRCQELIEQTVIGAGLIIPPAWMPFEVGADELLTLAEEVKRVDIVPHMTKVGRQAGQQSESREVKKIVPVIQLWCERLLTRTIVPFRAIGASQPAVALGQCDVDPTPPTPTIVPICPEPLPSRGSEQESTPNVNVPAASHDVDPLITPKGRRAAVDEKLAHVSRELQLFPALTHDVDFWHASNYQDRSTFEDWLNRGADKSESADRVFRYLLTLGPVAFNAAREQWPARRRAAAARKKREV